MQNLMNQKKKNKKDDAFNHEYKIKVSQEQHISKETHPAHIPEFDVQHPQHRQLVSRSLLL